MSVFRPRHIIGPRFFMTDQADRALYGGGAAMQNGPLPQRETGGNDGQPGESAGWRSRLRVPGFGRRAASNTPAELEAGTR